jgi:predicted esterase
VLHGYGASN